MKLPAIQFYPADWRKDPGVQAMGYFERGVWFEILCLMHESSERGKLLLNGQPMPDDALARVLGLDKQILTTTLTTILEYGVASRDPDSGALINRRMVKDESVRKVRTEAGKLGGNPVLLKQKTTTRDKQIPTPSSSSSVSSSTTSSEETKQQRAARSVEQRGTRLPDDFEIPESMYGWAADNAPHVEIRLAFDEFVDYWRGIPGVRGRKLDWPGTFRNRLRELESRAMKSGNGRKSNTEHTIDAVRSVIAKYENEH